MDTYISSDAGQTRELGKCWARNAKPGWVVGFTGDLGAGKTELIRGFAQGLGIPGRIQSPTFTLVHEYQEGKVPLFHLDLYRLENPTEVDKAGLTEYLHRPKGIAVVEWIERWFGTSDLAVIGSLKVRPPVYRHVWMESMDECRRKIVYEDFGN